MFFNCGAVSILFIVIAGEVVSRGEGDGSGHVFRKSIQYF